jgi:hypothetical protein
MGINIKGLVANRAKSVKFEAPGDFGEGRITAADMVDDPNDASRPQVLVITLVDEEDVERKLWARSAQMLEAIDEACDKSGSDGIEIGDWLKVTYVADKALRNGRTMKVYAAEHIAGFGSGEAFA